MTLIAAEAREDVVAGVVVVVEEAWHDKADVGLPSDEITFIDLKSASQRVPCRSFVFQKPVAMAFMPE